MNTLKLGSKVAAHNRHLQARNKYLSSIGKKYGLLTVLDVKYKPEIKKWFANAKCDCGRSTCARLDNILRGSTNSCGCRIPNWLVKKGDNFGEAALEKRSKTIKNSVIARTRKCNLPKYIHQQTRRSNTEAAHLYGCFFVDRKMVYCGAGGLDDIRKLMYSVAQKRIEMGLWTEDIANEYLKQKQT